MLVSMLLETDSKDSAAAKGIVWSQLRRSGTNDIRTDRPNLFYPLIFDNEGTQIIGAGESLPIQLHPTASIERKDGYLYLWPIKESGIEGNWQISQAEVLARVEKGYVKIGKIKGTAGLCPAPHQGGDRPGPAAADGS